MFLDFYVLKEWYNDFFFWFDLFFGDIYIYLIDIFGIYMREFLKVYKLLEVYEFFLSGYVKFFWFYIIDEDVLFCFIKGKVILF